MIEREGSRQGWLDPCFPRVAMKAFTKPLKFWFKFVYNLWSNVTFESWNSGLVKCDMMLKWSHWGMLKYLPSIPWDFSTYIQKAKQKKHENLIDEKKSYFKNGWWMFCCIPSPECTTGDVNSISERLQYEFSQNFVCTFQFQHSFFCVLTFFTYEYNTFQPFVHVFSYLKHVFGLVMYD